MCLNNDEGSSEKNKEISGHQRKKRERDEKNFSGEFLMARQGRIKAAAAVGLVCPACAHTRTSG